MARTELANAKDENPMMMGIKKAKRGEVSSLEFSCGRWSGSGVTLNPQYTPLRGPTRSRSEIDLPDQQEFFLSLAV